MQASRFELRLRSQFNIVFFAKWNTGSGKAINCLLYFIEFCLCNSIRFSENLQDRSLKDPPRREKSIKGIGISNYFGMQVLPAHNCNAARPAFPVQLLGNTRRNGLNLIVTI